MPGVQNEAMCNSFYIGGILSGFSVDLEPEFIPFTNAVNDLVEQANTALQSSYDSTCSTIGFLSEVLSFADPNSLLQPPDFCDDQSLQQLLCPPFTADGRTNDSCGAKATSTYTMVKIKDFDNGFRIFRCDDVPDMVSSLESAIEEARSQGSIPSGPAIRCASDGQFIGSKLYDDLSAKAKAAGTVLGQ